MPLDFDHFEVMTFDCYGTLIDWEAGILAVLQPLAARFGTCISGDALLESYGELESELEAGPYLPYREVLRRVLLGLSERLNWPADGFDEDALSRSVPDWPAFADSADALRHLQERYRLCIISNIDDDLFTHSAAKLGVAFDQVITAQQVSSYKPDPNNFRLAIARIGLAPDRILHAAQSLFHDIGPARKLGLKTAWINRRAGKPGFGATPRAAAKPDLEVPDLRTLADLVQG